VAIVPVKKIEVVGRHAQCQEILEALHELEAIQVTNPKEVLPEDEYREFLGSEEIGDGELEERLVRLGYAINYLAAFVPKESFLSGLARGKFILTHEAFAEILAKFNFDQICDGCKGQAGNFRQLANERDELLSQHREMEPWVNLDVPLSELADTRSTRVLLGILPAGNYDKFREGILGAAPESYIGRVGSDNAFEYLLVIFPKDSEEKVLVVLNKQDFNSIDYPRVDVTPRKFLSQIEDRLRRIESEEEELREKGQGLAKHRVKLMALYDYYVHMKERQDARGFLLKTQNAFYLAGWVRARDARKVKRELTRRFEPIAVAISSPEEGEEPPILLENRPAVRPFEFVTKLYGLPCYREVEPTVILAPFFAIFFAVCLTDAGYGLVLALLAWLVLKRMSLGQEGRALIKLLFTLGVTTIIIGALAGSFFGADFDLFPQNLGFLKEMRNRVMILDPLTDSLNFLIFALILGFIHVLCGFGTKMYGDIRNGRILDGILDQGSVLMLISGAVFFLLAKIGGLLPGVWIRLPEEPWSSVGLMMALIGCGVILLFYGRASKNLIGKLGSGFYKLYQILTGSILSDVLSYSRLMALGLATCVMAQSVNRIAALIPSVLSMIPGLGPLLSKTHFVFPLLIVMALIIGHIFVIAINTLGGFIHTARLQFVEFFQKFYIGGGEPFRPFRSETRYTVIRPEGSDN
jgi:V/A-type H+-transporting ATPase subunit I